MPTYNDERHIKGVIESFLTSWTDSVVELIIIDDGSIDKTVSIIKDSFEHDTRINLLEQKNSGPSVARNRGIREAKGEVILFTQGDIFASPQLLNRHSEFHRNRPDIKTALIGYTTWHNDLEITPFMYWLEHGGPQFDYGRLIDGEETDFLAFYTPNLSLKKDFLLELGGFDEDLKGPAGLTVYEDTDLGWRAQKQGMSLIYDKHAIAYHDHYKSFDTVIKRRELEGSFLYMLKKKHPDFSFADDNEHFASQIKKLKTSMIPDSIRVPLTQILFNPIVAWPCILLARFAEKRWNIPLIYKISCGYYYNKGIRSSKHGKAT